MYLQVVVNMFVFISNFRTIGYVSVRFESQTSNMEYDVADGSEHVHIDSWDKQSIYPTQRNENLWSNSMYTDCPLFFIVEWLGASYRFG